MNSCLIPTPLKPQYWRCHLVGACNGNTQIDSHRIRCALRPALNRIVLGAMPTSRIYSDATNQKDLNDYTAQGVYRLDCGGGDGHINGGGTKFGVLVVFSAQDAYKAQIKIDWVNNTAQWRVGEYRSSAMTWKAWNTI